jgi:cytochrome c oxidase assembly protein subunit 15
MGDRCGRQRSGLSFLHMKQPQRPAPYRPALFWFAVVTSILTFLLIGLGGLVTSSEAGMSVPDWPTSYGYNMFALPIQYWQGGVVYEHTHRLLASFLGLLVVVLTRWIGGAPSRVPLAVVGGLEMVAGAGIFLFFPHLKPVGHFFEGIGGVVLLAAAVWVRNAPGSPTLVWCGWGAFVLVQLQGLLGGLRVSLVLDWLGVPHGALAQMFLVLTAVTALLASRWWHQSTIFRQATVPRGLRHHVLGVTVLIFVQLLVAATMRHQHAGLAITDFPLAYGKVWPDTSPAAIAKYNAMRDLGTVGGPITAFQVKLHMVHRLMAYAILLGVVMAAVRARKKLGVEDGLTRFAMVWLGILLMQVFLGAETIWQNKAADVATCHVMVGALALLAGTLWYLVATRRAQLSKTG